MEMIKKFFSDKVNNGVFKLGAIAYGLWFLFLIYNHPIQFIEGKIGVKAGIAMVVSFIAIGVVLFYIDRIYVYNAYIKRREESRKKFRDEMREIEKEWARLEALGYGRDRVDFDLTDKEVI